MDKVSAQSFYDKIAEYFVHAQIVSSRPLLEWGKGGRGLGMRIVISMTHPLHSHLHNYAVGVHRFGCHGDAIE